MSDRVRIGVVLDHDRVEVRPEDADAQRFLNGHHLTVLRVLRGMLTEHRLRLLTELAVMELAHELHEHLDKIFGPDLKFEVRPYKMLHRPVLSVAEMVPIERG